MGNYRVSSMTYIACFFLYLSLKYSLSVMVDKVSKTVLLGMHAFVMFKI